MELQDAQGAFARRGFPFQWKSVPGALKKRKKTSSSTPVPHAVPLLPVLPLAEDIAIVQAIAIHAGITARENRSEHHALERASSAVPVHIETAAPRTLPDAGPGCPHGVQGSQC